MIFSTPWMVWSRVFRVLFSLRVPSGFMVVMCLFMLMVASLLSRFPR